MANPITLKDRSQHQRKLASPNYRIESHCSRHHIGLPSRKSASFSLAHSFSPPLVLCVPEPSMPPKTSECTRCRRKFGSTPHADCKPGEVVKRRGSYACCNSCFSMCSIHPDFKDLTNAELTAKIEADQEEYMATLEDYEAQKRQGKRFKTGPRSTAVKAETRHGFTTRVLQGYLWTQQLLRKHREEELWTTLPRQTIAHFGRTVTGVLREKSAIGAIEIYEDSQLCAVRSNHLGEYDHDDDEAQDAHKALSKQILVSKDSRETGGEDEAIQLRSKRSKADDGIDDFSSIWGLNSQSVVGGGKPTKPEEDEALNADPKPKNKRARGSGGSKRERSSTTSLPTSTASNPEEPDGNAETKPSASASASWLFGGQGRGFKGKGGGRGSKELDVSEKVLQQFENMRRMFADEEQFYSLSFKKATDLSEKIHARSVDDLQKVYRDISQAPGGLEKDRALSVMRRLATASIEITCVCQVISAVNDPEATSATLKEGLDEAETAKLAFPVSLRKMFFARWLLEISRGGEWERYLEILQSRELTKIFEEGHAETLAGFQQCCVQTTINNFLQQDAGLY